MAVPSLVLTDRGMGSSIVTSPAFLTTTEMETLWLPSACVVTGTRKPSVTPVEKKKKSMHNFYKNI